MKIDKCEYRAGQLILSTSDAEAMRLAYKFKPGEYELKRKAKSRSLSANAYAWELIGKLAERLKIPRTEIYRNEIKEIGGNSWTAIVAPEAVEMAIKSWEAQGLGWQAEILTQLDTEVEIEMFYGSSVYTTEQMSRLIDNLVEQCKTFDIETRPQEEIDSLLRSWNE